MLTSSPALGAEQVKLIYGPFNGKISIDCLKTYAETGEITREFRLYAKFLNKETLVQLRHWLQKRFDSDRVQLYQYTHSPEGEEFLQQLGTAVKTHPQRNGFYAIRSALIEAADKPNESDGWTLIDAMYKFPTDDLQINTKDLFNLQTFWQESETAKKPGLEVFGKQ
ncbi:MAG: hypothetical protein Tsb0014_28670 [Pleurocapsa sp.]